METLLTQYCVPVEENARALEANEIRVLHAQVPDWEIVADGAEKHLRRAFGFQNFAGALAFANKVGEQAEIENHHPRMVVEWGRVTLDWWTHTVRGLHPNDFIMATRIDDLFARWDLISGQKDEVQEASEESFPASDPPAY